MKETTTTVMYVQLTIINENETSEPIYFPLGKFAFSDQIIRYNGKEYPIRETAAEIIKLLE